MQAVFQRVAQLFAALVEPGPDDLEKTVVIGDFYGRLGPTGQPDDGRVDFGAGDESAGRDAGYDFRPGVELHADGEEAHVGGPGHDSPGDFSLDGEDDQLRWVDCG